MRNRSDNPATETAIVATLATAARTAILVLAALGATHGAAELLSAF